MTTESSTEFTELIPGLPEELSLECLTRLHHTSHRFAAAVCRRWRHLIHSKDFYYHRMRTGSTRKTACLIQSRPVQTNPDETNTKPAATNQYCITLFDPVSGSWDRVDPIPDFPNGAPLFCQLVSSEGVLVALGGWNPTSYEPVRHVFVYRFSTGTWFRGKDMPGKRSFFAAAAGGGRVYVAGGHDESKNALSSAWAYDIGLDEWAELGPMGEERDECQGVMFGSGFWVISGYGTDSQGNFKNNADVYDIGSGTWTRVEGVWGSGKCPRSCVGVGRGEGMFSWSEVDESVRVGTCGVDMGDQVLVTGSGYEGGPHGFYLMDIKRDGERGKLVKLDVPDEFSGFVQSGCCIEI